MCSWMELFDLLFNAIKTRTCLSPDLLNFYSENILREISNIRGVVIGGYNLNNIRYADDTALIAEAEEKLQELTEAVSTENEKRGPTMNVKNTECMVIRKEEETFKCEIKIGLEKIKQVAKSDGKSENEIKRRIAMAKVSFQKLGNILRGRKMNVQVKSKVLKYYMQSILLYGSECWTISPTVENRLNAAESWSYRRMLRISWKEYVLNEEALKRSKAESAKYVRSIRQRQLRPCGSKFPLLLSIYVKFDSKRIALSGQFSNFCVPVM